MVSAAQDLILNLPRPKYPPIRLGLSTGKTRLDCILEAARIEYQSYILYVEAYHKSSAGRVPHEEVFLILTVEGLVALPRRGQDIIEGAVPWKCSYVQIESVSQAQSSIRDHFCILLKFYDRDADASKIITMTFDCKEQKLVQDENQEEVKGGERLHQQRAPQGGANIANIFMQATLSEQQGMKPMEFSILYLIERQLPVFWHREFEKNLQLKSNDFYQYHAFVVKRNTYFFNQRRFIILTQHFMINVEAEFNKDCSDIQFKDTKWKVPLAALKALQIEKSGEYNKLTVFFDLPELNSIMAGYGAKKPQKKDKRALKFVDLHVLRDFVFHLKRLYHLHRRSKVAKDAGKDRAPITVECKQ